MDVEFVERGDNNKVTSGKRNEVVILKPQALPLDPVIATMKRLMV